ncbi:MAG TPA: hypothetical protein VFG09_00360 [Thermodesulfovibrionales bacterium]|nr:hypothetical protein [Thermodesulfovibrionales bacterium]
MLRIQKSVKADVVTYSLGGRIKAEEVSEVKRLLELEIEKQDGRIVTDLEEVK